MADLFLARSAERACQQCVVSPSQLQIPVFTLSPSEADQIKGEAADIVNRRAPSTETEKVLVAEAVFREIKRISPLMVMFLRGIQAPGGDPARAVRGLPVTDRNVAQIISLALGLVLGEPFQYLQQNLGKLAALLAPQLGAKANSNATFNDFAHHTDDSILAAVFRTLYIALYGLKNECHAPTGYTALKWILPFLGPDELLLKRPNFQFRGPASLDLGDAWSQPQPILWTNQNGDPCITFPTYNTRVVDGNEDTLRAVKQLTDLLNTFTTYFVVGPGDYLVFSNDRGTHCRKSISGEREVFRSYLRDDLRALRERTGEAGHVFDLRKMM